ncbi:TetR/AcrR family transcriptional regulator C-terminal domain-containing protein [Kineococcus sp. NUM-3379]
MAETASARIAAELRADIAAGRLAPGGRLPSTREITRRWGVAMATATRVLALLRAEGLARPVPGVGTVVVAPAPPAALPAAALPHPQARGSAARHRPGRVPAWRERIAWAAVAVADTEGLAAVSMRRVAAELGVAPMSLYQHLGGKQDLLWLMVDAAFGEVELPEHRPGGWRAALEAAAHVTWASFRRHPWLAAAMSVTRPQMVPSALAHTERVLAALCGDGADTATAMTVHVTLFTFLRGAAVDLDAETLAEADTGVTSEEWVRAHLGRLHEAAPAGTHPTVRRMAADDTFDLDLDALVGFGVRRLLDGFEGVLGRAAGTSPVPGRDTSTACEDERRART